MEIREYSTRHIPILLLIIFCMQHNNNEKEKRILDI